MTIPVIDQVDDAASGKEELIDELFFTMRDSMVFRIHVSASVGLALAFYGGIHAGTTYADQSITLAASSTNYVEQDTTTFVITSNTTAYTGGSKRNLGIALTSASGRISWEAEDIAPSGGGPGGGSAPKVIQFAVTDETTAITTGTAKITLRAPYAISTVTVIRASLSAAQASGSIFTVDVNKNGSSMLSTKITIDNTETTSVAAATAAVLSSTSIADDDVISVDVDQVGSGSAAGLKVAIIGA